MSPPNNWTSRGLVEKLQLLGSDTYSNLQTFSDFIKKKSNNCYLSPSYSTIFVASFREIVLKNCQEQNSVALEIACFHDKILSDFKGAGIVIL